MKKRVLWRDYDVTENEKMLLNCIVEGNLTFGVTTDEVKHLLEGDVNKTRNTLHRLAQKKLLKKKIVKLRRDCLGFDGIRKVARFYPRTEKQANV